jgi:hypothetical protein
MTLTPYLIELVWSKAIIIPGKDSRYWRKDTCGAWINRFEHGNRNSQFGWEIDHILAVINGGSDLINNLRPLHWRNNASKSDGRLTCPVKAVV